MFQDFSAFVISQCEKKKPRGPRLVDELITLWGASRSHTYKKINGQVPVTLEEAFIAAKKYGFSLDEFVSGQSDQVLFRYPTLGQLAKTAQRFLSELRHSMAVMCATPGTRIRYATNEIPVFYYLLYPELTAFKMYLWSRSVWNSVADPAAPGMDWIGDLLADQEFQVLSTSTFDTFASIPTDEYYPLNMLDNTLNQIRFMVDIGQINSDFTHVLSAQLLALTEWMGRAAAQGKKLDSAGNAGATLELHFNEMLYSNNIILLSNPEQGLLFSTLDNPNFIVTNDGRLLGRIEEWLDQMRTKSIKISGDGERERERYFQSLRSRIGQ